MIKKVIKLKFNVFYFQIEIRYVVIICFIIFFQALGKDFHSEHFVCVSCNLSLTGHRYVLTGKNNFTKKNNSINCKQRADFYFF